MPTRIGILTVSDRVSRGAMEDRGGPAIAAALSPLEHEIVVRKVVSDDVDDIASALRTWADEFQLDAILTTGGTGLGPRDVTPEATMQICDRLVPGIAETLRAAGLNQTPQSMLSRGVAGVRGRTLIVNLPGSPRGAQEGVEILLPVLPHAAAMLGGGGH
jgi:molybdopterin adenylyltransferase